MINTTITQSNERLESKISSLHLFQKKNQKHQCDILNSDRHRFVCGCITKAQKYKSTKAQKYKKHTNPNNTQTHFYNTYQVK
tara:strand:- start:953 stop:1198 length:246 start_codon:yes stop_codon:yes gene_type:complete